MKTLSTIRSALVIIGGGLIALPASALELGEVTIHSALGQPLRASIPYALAPFEALSDQCVSIRPAAGPNAIGPTKQEPILIANGTITINGGSVIREPLVAMRLTVNCHYTPRLTREVFLFVDPPGTTPIVAPAPERVTRQPQLNTPPVRRAVVPASPAPASPAPVADTGPEPVIPTEQSTAYELPVVAEEPAPEPETSPMVELKPGDVIIHSDNPYVEPTVTVEDVEAVAPEPVAPAPSESVSIIRQPQKAPASQSNWLIWLGGGAVAVVLALMLLGGRIRKHFGSSPIAPAQPKRAVVEHHTEAVAALGEVDIEIDDDSPTAENLALDADLLAGTGLQETNDVDVAQDFGFAATTELDLELPEEMASNVDVPETDILPPLHADDDKILDDEVLPDDDYDLSMNVDATNMPNPDDVTQRDLEAVQVDDDDDTLIGNDYTVSKEVDYNIVEQDYEDELSATQALNEEIMNATTQAAANESSADETVEMPKDGKKAS